jgi:ABC-type multidrug transport system fused ATPase/permease subunit
MRAERVLVLDNGRMAGWGKHEDLIREGGVYRRIYEQQQAQAEDELPLEVDGEAVKTV